jgi:YhcH/YjgK/YiaL family protein
MIVDKFSNIRFYGGLLNHLEDGLQAIEALGSDPATGRYEFDGGFFMVQEGQTRPMEEGSFEAHRDYVDVQIFLEGGEEMAWADVSDLKVITPYDKAKDIEFLEGSYDHVIRVTAGMCYVVFPEDAHKPASHTAAPLSYRKIVLKLPV